MSRDLQRGTVYSAEQTLRTMIEFAERNDVSFIAVGGSTIVLPRERRFGDLASVQAYINAVLAMRQVRAAYPGRTAQAVTVRERQGENHAHYQFGEIALPTHRGSRSSWAMRELVVLHELAHHLTVSARQDHGPEFAEAFVFLVTEVMGEEAGFALTVIMREAGVKIGK